MIPQELAQWGGDALEIAVVTGRAHKITNNEVISWSPCRIKRGSLTYPRIGEPVVDDADLCTRFEAAQPSREGVSRHRESIERRQRGGIPNEPLRRDGRWQPGHLSGKQQVIVVRDQMHLPSTQSMELAGEQRGEQGTQDRKRLDVQKRAQRESLRYDGVGAGQLLNEVTDAIPTRALGPRRTERLVPKTGSPSRPL